MGQELTVSEGSTVGREVREAMVDAGASEEDAVYVHRKHIRVEKDEHSYYLTRLGENSLTVNGETVEKGDAAWINDGDEICFSDVVTATVSIR
jgi:predicted component of type VI protein secretion system